MNVLIQDETDIGLKFDGLKLARVLNDIISIDDYKDIKLIVPNHKIKDEKYRLSCKLSELLDLPLVEVRSNELYSIYNKMSIADVYILIVDKVEDVDKNILYSSIDNKTATFVFTYAYVTSLINGDDEDLNKKGGMK